MISCRRLLRVPWTARRSNQSILKEISPGCSLEGLMLKLKLQYFGHLMWRADSLEKTPVLGKIEGRRKGTVEDEMVGWCHWLNGNEFEQALGDGEGQRSLACWSLWSHKELDMIELLNNYNNWQYFITSLLSRVIKSHIALWLIIQILEPNRQGWNDIHTNWLYDFELIKSLNLRFII